MARIDGVQLTAAQRNLLADRLSEYGAKRHTAAAIGCTGQHLNSIIAGDRRPSRDLLAALCKQLKLRCEFPPPVIEAIAR